MRILLLLLFAAPALAQQPVTVTVSTTVGPQCKLVVRVECEPVGEEPPAPPFNLEVIP